MSHWFAHDFPVETEQHRRLRDSVWRALGSWRPFVIAVDGRDGTGKSTLARYLAWQLGMPAIETDLFLVPDTGIVQYREGEPDTVIQSRLRRKRPVIVEGVCVLDVQERVGVAADFHVWVEQDDWTGTHGLSTHVQSYVLRRDPKQHAHWVFQWAPDSERV